MGYDIGVSLIDALEKLEAEEGIEPSNDGFAQPSQSRVHAVAANAVDVGVARVAAEDAEHDSAHDVVGTAAAIASVAKRAFAQKLLPACACLEELKKEEQLALTGDGCLIGQLGMKATTWSVERPTCRKSFLGVFGLTLWVNRNRRFWDIHDAEVA